MPGASHGRRRRAGWLLLACTLTAVDAAQGAPFEFSGEGRALLDARSANRDGPVAAANALSPGLAPVDAPGQRVEAELRGSWHPAATRPWLSTLAGNLRLATEHREGKAGVEGRARVNELHAGSDLGAWQLGAGKRIVGWDVGHGFRPNDVVQQQERRTLLTTTPEGRTLLQVERFGAEQAASLVWVNPHHVGRDPARQRGALESALAARWYLRDGAADWHLFSRWGHHTRASAGAALAWVAGDELELHASARALQRHDGRVFDAPALDALVAANPWQQAMLGRAVQALLGAGWTGAQRQSLLLEWWHDGTAPSDGQWSLWQQRHRALAAFGATPGVPAAAVTATAGNLAWQATPFDGANLRRDNLFVRLAWSPEPWQLSFDALVTPADRGRVLTLALQWQGDRLRLNAAWRVYGGPADAVLAQLPQRRVGLLAASWAF